MKKLAFLLVLLLAIPIFHGCEETEDEGKAPEIPPYETMAVDFEGFLDINSDATKSADLTDTYVNFGSAAIVVAVWNVYLGVALVVPVAAFYKSFTEEPVFLGDAKWQWTYTVTSLGGEYTARMTGEIRANDIKWEMYVAKAGVGKFDEFLWYEGTSALDGTNGQWILYHSAKQPEKMLQIDWEKSTEKIGKVKYTYIMEKTALGTDDPAKGGYLEYGLQEKDLDAYYNIHAYNKNLEEFKDIEIEWSTAAYNGHIKAAHVFGSEDWQCWDSEGKDTSCE